MVLTCCYRYVKFTIMEKENRKEMIEFINKLDELCWQYKIEIKPTNPIPDDELPTISIISGDEVVKLVYIDGDGGGK